MGQPQPKWSRRALRVPRIGGGRRSPLLGCPSRWRWRGRARPLSLRPPRRARGATCPPRTILERGRSRGRRRRGARVRPRGGWSRWSPG
eukprot:scaffold19137_cov124-Isochrysis_galbana.AAC.1